MSTAHGTEKDERRDGRPSGGLPDRLRRASQTPCGFQLVEQPRGLGLGVVSGSATTPSSAARWQLVADSQDRNVGDRSIMAWFVAPCFASLDHDVGRSRRWIRRLPPPRRISQGPRPWHGQRRRPWRGQRPPSRGGARAVPLATLGRCRRSTRHRSHLPRQAPSGAGRCQSLLGLHKSRARRWIDEDQQLGRAKWHADGRGAGGMVD